MCRALPDRLHRATGCSLIRFRSKARRSFAYHAERAFECDAHLADQAIIEQPAEDGDSMRHAPRRIKLRQRVGLVGRPIAARFRYLDKTGTQSERWMTGEVCDR